MLKLDRKQKLGQMRADKKENSIDKFVLLCNRISGGPEAPFGGPSSPQASRRRTYLTLGLGVVIVGMSVSSALSLKISHDPLKFIESDHPIRINFEKLDREIGGTAQINLLIDAKSPKGLRDLNFIKALEKFEKSLMDYKHPELQEKIVTSISSILEIIRETNKSLHNDDPNYYRIPDSDRALSDILFIFENTAPEDLRRMTTADLSRSLMTVQLHWLPCTSYKPLTKYLNNYIENNLKDFATIQPTGLVYSMLSTLGTLAVDLFNSFGIALLVITILMIMLLQDIKLGLVSLIPNLVPIIMVLGIMYLVNIPLNLTNILLGSIAIGLCVDDTIHLLHHYRVCRLSGFDVEKSIEEALRVSGKSIVSTSLVIIMGLSSYLTANLTNLTQFGLLIILCIFCALFTDLTLGPAVLRLLHGKKA